MSKLELVQQTILELTKLERQQLELLIWWNSSKLKLSLGLATLQQLPGNEG